MRRKMERLRVKIVHLFKLNPHRGVVMGTEEEFIEDINDRAFLAYNPDFQFELFRRTFGRSPSSVFMRV